MNANGVIPYALACVFWQAAEALSFLLIPFTVFRLANSPLWAGVVSASILLPRVITPIPLGIWMDRLGLKPALFSSAILGFFSLVFLAEIGIQHKLTILIFCFLQLIIETANVARRKSKNIIVPFLVHQTHYSKLNSLLSGLESAGELLGPLLGGFAVSAIGIYHSFYISATLFLVAGLCLLFLPPLPGHSLRESGIADGIHFLFKGNQSPILISLLKLFFSCWGALYLFDEKQCGRYVE